MAGLDIGSGGGHLELSLAQITDMEIILFDIEQDALAIANKRACNWGLSERTSTMLGDVHDIPINDDSIELCVSRGSVWFWEDQKRGLKEIYRVLTKGGTAYIGGGFGNKELKDQVDRKMRERDNEWPKRREKFVEGNSVEHFAYLLNQIGIKNFEVKDDEEGLWIIFRKEKELEMR